MLLLTLHICVKFAAFSVNIDILLRKILVAFYLLIYYYTSQLGGPPPWFHHTVKVGWFKKVIRCYTSVLITLHVQFLVLLQFFYSQYFEL